MRLHVSAQEGGDQDPVTFVWSPDVPRFEDELGKYNWETLDAIDYTLTLLEEYNIKAIIVPHNADMLGGPGG